MLELIVVFAHWCPTCNMMLPIVEELEKDYKDKMGLRRIDIDKYPQVVAEYGIEIVPTFILRRGNVELVRMTGMIGENILRKRIKHEII